MGVNINQMIENGVKSAKPFAYKHRLLLVSILISGILFGVGSNMHSSAAASVAAVQRQLDDINNEIAQFDSAQHQVIQDINHIDHGLDTERWKKDDEIAAKWIQPAFSFTNSSEYTEHRDLYINRLSDRDPFVTVFLPAYVPVYQEQSNELGEIDDGTNIFSRVTSFKSYVAGLNEETDVYSYVAILKCETRIPPEYGYKGMLQGVGRQLGQPAENIVILVYDVVYNESGEGQIENFAAYMNSFEKYVPVINNSDNSNNA